MKIIILNQFNSEKSRLPPKKSIILGHHFLTEFTAFELVHNICGDCDDFWM